LASDNPWQKLIGEPEFRNAIDNKGYYESNLSFQPFVKKYELTLKSRPPAYLSIDFWSGQSKVLTKNKLYVLRTGKGRFVIFSEERFPKPYLELRRDDSVTDIDFELPENYEHLRKAFRNHYQEATNLEYLRFIGVYDKLIEELFEKSNRHYFIGPRGNRNSDFRLYLIDKMKPNEPVLFEYSGQEDLDYTIWTEDSVLVFEAKQFISSSGGLDIGWHKLAFPCYRFYDFEGLNIIPIYYLRQQHSIYLFIFSRMEFYNGGVLLNDISKYTPVKVFRINVASQASNIIVPTSL
jgi:hypothetical protein